MGGQGRDKGSTNKVPNKPSLEIGAVYGAWTILSFEGARHRYPPDTRKDQFWTCKCNHCGKIMSRSTSMLKGNKNGTGNGCDCLLVKPNAAINRSFRTYKRFAKLRGLSFDLTFDFFKQIISKPCAYCGKEPEVNSYSSDVIIKVPMNGIDRRDSDKSYTVENCVPCCTMCNLSKLDWPEDVFIAWVKRIVKFQSKDDPTLSSWTHLVDHTPAVGVEGVPKPDEELEWETTFEEETE